MQHQRSELLPNLISVSGEADVARPSFTVSSSDARSLLDVTFHVTAPTPIELAASGTVFNGGAAPVSPHE